MDEATNKIYSAFLIEEGGTTSTLRALAEVFAEQVLSSSLQIWIWGAATAGPVLQAKSTLDGPVAGPPTVSDPTIATSTEADN